MDWKLPREGGCRCDRVRLAITAPPILTAACHCTGCQRMTGSAFSLSAAIPSEGFRSRRASPSSAACTVRPITIFAHAA